MSTPENRDLHLRVRRLVVDAAVLQQAGLGAAAFSQHLQEALRRRAVGDTAAAGTTAPAAIEPVADAVWSQLQGSTGQGSR